MRRRRRNRRRHRRGQQHRIGPASARRFADEGALPLLAGRRAKAPEAARAQPGSLAKALLGHVYDRDPRASRKDAARL